MDMNGLQNKVKEQLDPYRYQHTLGVMYTAASLAMKYEEDLKKAMIAGLLHDCAKCIPNDEKIKMCEEYGILLTETELLNKALIHPKLGAYLAKAEYHIDDPEILEAIKWHTTGHPKMGLLEKIIFIADYIEPGREEAPHLSLIRKTAFEDIDEAMYIILKDTLEYLKTRKGVIDPMTEETYHYYKKITHKEEF